MAKYTFSQSVKDEQIALNAKGANLKTDGLLGPLTLAARAKFSTPTNVNTETPGSDLLPLPGADAPTSNLGNLRLALNTALTEAAQTTAKNRISALSGLMGGGADPSVLKAAVGLAQSGLAQSRESIMSDVLKTYDEERKRIEFNPDQFRSVQRGIYDLKTNEWVIKPKPEVERGSGKTISRTDAMVLNLPISLVGTSWKMFQTQIDNDVPPEWFLNIAADEKKGQPEDPAEKQQVMDAINARFDAGDKEGARALAHAYNQKRSGISKEELKSLWDQFREAFLGTFAGNSRGENLLNSDDY